MKYLSPKALFVLLLLHIGVDTSALVPAGTIDQNICNSLLWKTPADVSFIAVIHVARAKEAATRLFVNMSLSSRVDADFDN